MTYHRIMLEFLLINVCLKRWSNLKALKETSLISFFFYKFFFVKNFKYFHYLLKTLFKKNWHNSNHQIKNFKRFKFTKKYKLLFLPLFHIKKLEFCSIFKIMCLIKQDLTTSKFTKINIQKIKTPLTVHITLNDKF